MKSSKEKQADDSVEIQNIFGLSKALIFIIRLILLTLICLIIYYYFIFLLCNNISTTPSELGLPTLFIFIFTTLLIFLIPWHKLNLRLIKFLGIEFEQKLEGQATEHAEDLSDIENRLSFIEEKLPYKNIDFLYRQIDQEQKLKPLLESYFNKYSNIAYSPLKIRGWGSKQEGFSDLSNYEPYIYKSLLRKLVSEGFLETRLSSKGNTLYKKANQ